MTDTHTPAERPANLTALQLQLLDLAARADHSRKEHYRSPLLHLLDTPVFTGLD
jgi:hypothetical protein